MNIDMDQVKWRLEVTIHGYRAFGLIDGGGARMSCKQASNV